MKDLEKIELRSDEVQEILTRPPHVLIRYGISVACGIFLILFAGCFLFKYPDIVIGEAIITTENPPVWLVSKSTGRIKELLCREKQIVNKGDLLAVIDNAANTEDVKLLDSLLNKVIITDSIFHIPIELYAEQYELGNLQSAFSGFTKAVVNYNNFLSINLTNQEITALQKQIAGRKDYSSSLQNQLVLRENELAIAKSTCEREESLYKKGIIAQAEFEVAKQAYLNSQQSLKQLQTSIINENLETVQFKESLKKLTLQYLQNKNQYYSELLSAYRELIASIESWKQTCLLISPVNGNVTFNKFWKENQYVETGDKVLAVIPQQPGDIIGKINIPSSGFGKVKVNQITNIKLDGYPYLEYGVLKSKISNISLIPAENRYTVEVELIDGLKTSTGKISEFTGELSGQAEIITDNRSLGDRLFSPLRYLWKEKIIRK